MVAASPGTAELASGLTLPPPLSTPALRAVSATRQRFNAALSSRSMTTPHTPQAYSRSLNSTADAAPVVGSRTADVERERSDGVGFSPLVPPENFEISTPRLRAGCSSSELWRRVLDGSRTHTVRLLEPFPLPIGVRGRKDGTVPPPFECRQYLRWESNPQHVRSEPTSSTNWDTETSIADDSPRHRVVLFAAPKRFARVQQRIGLYESRGREGTRTPNHLFVREALCQLSYSTLRDP